MELGTERAPLSLWKWEVEPLLQTLCFVPLKRKKVNQQQFLLKFRSSSYEKKITTGTTKWTTWTKWCCPDQSPDGIPGPWLWTSMCAGWGSVWRLELLFYFYHLLQVIEFPFSMKGFHIVGSHPDHLTQWPCHLNLPSVIPVKMALYVPQSSILVLPMQSKSKIRHPCEI